MEIAQSVDHNKAMAKKSKEADATAKRSRTGRMLIEVRALLAPLVADYAANNAMDNTEAANRLILLALKSEGYRIGSPQTGEEK